MDNRKIAGIWPYRRQSNTLVWFASLRAHGVGRAMARPSITATLRRFGRPLSLALGLGALAMTAACTTVEGTNALTSPQTFEREVMTETLMGIGIIPRENTKEALNAPRGPLVEPPNSDMLPPPTESMAAMLPEDSDKPVLDPTGLTQEDLRLIRGARVYDLDIGSGRELTPKEAEILTARLRLYRTQQQQQRTQQSDFPLEMPPLHLFTTVGDTEYICLAESGDLVALDDPACPPAIREALAAEQ
jgi:hypothetical protein